jgi:hypothetical protein
VVLERDAAPVPGGQADRHIEAPAGLRSPEGHDRHVSADGAPTAALKVPAGQREQMAGVVAAS